MPGVSVAQNNYYVVIQLIDTLIKRLPRDIGNDSLNRAQNTCPVQTGELFRSLYVKINTDGFKLGATVPYASDVERGTQPVNVGGSWTGKWKRHKRHTKNGTTTIAGHTKTFKGKKPVNVNGQWRTLSSSPGREGTFFMKNAVSEALSKGLKKALRSMGN